MSAQGASVPAVAPAAAPAAQRPHQGAAPSQPWVPGERCEANRTPGGGGWLSGTVTSFDAVSGTVFVKFDDYNVVVSSRGARASGRGGGWERRRCRTRAG